MKAVQHEAIQQRAYEIWELSGRQHGLDKEHWEQAERELLDAAPSVKGSEAVKSGAKKRRGSTSEVQLAPGCGGGGFVGHGLIARPVGFRLVGEAHLDLVPRRREAAAQDDDRATEINPQEQCDDGSKRPIEFVEISHVFGVK